MPTYQRFDSEACFLLLSLNTYYLLPVHLDPAGRLNKCKYSDSKTRAAVAVVNRLAAGSDPTGPRDATRDS